MVASSSITSSMIDQPSLGTINPSIWHSKDGNRGLFPPTQSASARFWQWKIPRKPFWIKYPCPLDSPGLFDNPSTIDRRRLIYLTTFFSFISLIFTILVMLGNMYDQSVLNRIYFLKLDLTNLIPTKVSNYGLINSITQTLGLCDFYQVGLWGYCEGYNLQGVTFCSKPKRSYWFDPVEIITHQLLKGAKIALPDDIARPLQVAKRASYWMSVFWIIAAVFSFFSMCLSWIAMYSHWCAGFTSGIAGIAMASTTMASVMASTIYCLFRTSFESARGVAISGILGTEMFVYMWMASGFTIMAFILHCGMCCCIGSEKEYRKERQKNRQRSKGAR